MITTYGEDSWRDLAWSRAYPSVVDQAEEVIVHHEPNLAIGPARNAAGKRATGQWLCHLDADDELAPDYIELMEAAIAEHAGKKGTLYLFQPSVQYVRKKTKAKPVLIPEGDLRNDNFLVVGTVVNRNLLQSVGGFNDLPHGFEDWSAWAKCWKAGAQIVPVPEAVYIAYINLRSKHRTQWRNKKEQVETHMRVAAELFPENA